MANFQELHSLSETDEEFFFFPPALPLPVPVPPPPPEAPAPRRRALIRGLMSARVSPTSMRTKKGSPCGEAGLPAVGPGRAAGAGAETGEAAPPAAAAAAATRAPAAGAAGVGAALSTEKW